MQKSGEGQGIQRKVNEGIALVSTIKKYYFKIIFINVQYSDIIMYKR